MYRKVLIKYQINIEELSLSSQSSSDIYIVNK